MPEHRRDKARYVGAHDEEECQHDQVNGRSDFHRGLDVLARVRVELAELQDALVHPQV